MQFKMNEITIPDTPSFNYEELKSGLLEKASKYETMVYGEDQIKDAKADRSALNKLKKALNDERIRQERAYMQPFDEFKAQVNEIIGIIDKPISVIDKQIKDYEEQQKEEKLEKIKEIWHEFLSADKVPEGITFNQINDPKWLNASVSMKKVKEAMEENLNQIADDMKTLEKLPEFSFEAVEVYKQTLDMNKAISEGQRLADIQKRKAEAEAKAAAENEVRMAEGRPTITPDNFMQPVEPEPEQHCQPEGQWLRFEAFLNVDQAGKLKKFFETNNISFRAI